MTLRVWSQFQQSENTTQVPVDFHARERPAVGLLKPIKSIFRWGIYAREDVNKVKDSISWHLTALSRLKINGVCCAGVEVKHRSLVPQ